MRWIKKGKIFDQSSDIDFSHSHAALPSPYIIEGGTIRIFYATRDEEQRSRITFIDVEERDPSRIKYIHDKPIFELGGMGTFDDRGATPSGLFNINGRNFFYYNGYNIGDLARYRIAVGVAEIDAEFSLADKLSSGPVQDRNMDDPCGVATPFVIYDKRIARYVIFYTSFTHWKTINGDEEPFYRIVRAESEDGLSWFNKSICIDFDSSTDGGIVRPTVIYADERYHMWYSIRSNSGYREDLAASYRIKYAYSANGIDWVKSSEAAIEPSTNKGDWDHDMTAYPYVLETSENTYMFYNGNGFGKSGFGYAVLEK